MNTDSFVTDMSKNQLPFIVFMKTIEAIYKQSIEMIIEQKIYERINNGTCFSHRIDLLVFVTSREEIIRTCFSCWSFSIQYSSSSVNLRSLFFFLFFLFSLSFSWNTLLRWTRSATNIGIVQVTRQEIRISWSNMYIMLVNDAQQCRLSTVRTRSIVSLCLRWVRDERTRHIHRRIFSIETFFYPCHFPACTI
jgi:hypothetical protein